MAGLKAFWGWMKAHPWTAAILFLLVVPFMLYGVLGKVRSTVQGLPGVGPLASKLPNLGGE